MDISPNVVIMTKEEFRELENQWFQKGVERGKFEARSFNPTHFHYKGGFYQLIGFGQHTETAEDLALYRGENAQLWARPKSMWSELVGERQRFTPLSPSNRCVKCDGRGTQNYGRLQCDVCRGTGLVEG